MIWCVVRMVLNAVEPCWTTFWAQGVLQLAESELNTYTLELKAPAAAGSKNMVILWNGDVSKLWFAGEYWNLLNGCWSAITQIDTWYSRFYRTYPKPIPSYPQIWKCGNLCAAGAGYTFRSFRRCARKRLKVCLLSRLTCIWDARDAGYILSPVRDVNIVTM